MVLSSSNINETSGFCTQYCGFHTHATLGGVDIKYAFVGNPDRCPSGCEIQTTGPNSPAASVGGADGLINVISHEQFEAITDPDLNAWFDASGQEDSDKCNFNFGTTSTCNVYRHLLGGGQSCGCQIQPYFWQQRLDDPAAVGKRRRRQVRPAPVNNSFAGRLLLAALISFLESANSWRIMREVICNGKIKHGWIASLQML